MSSRESCGVVCLLVGFLFCFVLRFFLGGRREIEASVHIHVGYAERTCVGEIDGWVCVYVDDIAICKGKETREGKAKLGMTSAIFLFRGVKNRIA